MNLCSILIENGNFIEKIPEEIKEEMFPSESYFEVETITDSTFDIIKYTNEEE